MPSWYFLPARDISDLLAFMMDKREKRADLAAALKQLKTTGDQRGRIVKWGKSRYDGLCKSCHGPDAEGRIRFGDVPVRGYLTLLTVGDGLAEAQWWNGPDKTFDLPIELTIYKESSLSGLVLAPDGKPEHSFKPC